MILSLDEHKGLFKNEASYHELVELFKQALSVNSMPLILAEKEVVFTALSPEGTKELLRDRILKRFSEDPGLLAEMKDRLEKDVIVE
jgi:hypothetical protein